jgi:hypothetical protein
MAGLANRRPAANLVSACYNCVGCAAELSAGRLRASPRHEALIKSCSARLLEGQAEPHSPLTRFGMSAGFEAG